MERSLDQLEQELLEKINGGYNDIVRVANESLENILQLSVFTAETLDFMLQNQP